jgi:hypothetical protein
MNLGVEFQENLFISRADQALYSRIFDFCNGMIENRPRSFYSTRLKMSKIFYGNT